MLLHDQFFTVLTPTHFEKLRPCICNETPLCLWSGREIPGYSRQNLKTKVYRAHI